MEKLYIGLVDTPGLFAWMIRKAIRQDYIHVVLGMDEMLDCLLYTSEKGITNWFRRAGNHLN